MLLRTPADTRAGLAEVWPLFGLRIDTPAVALRVPTDDDLIALADRAADVHEPDARPIIAAWTASTGVDRARALLQHHWSQRAGWSPARWTLDLAVVLDGEPVGVQSIRSDSFAVTRSVTTSSWLHRPLQGQGIGTEMRRAALHLAFAGLAAERAETETATSNAASIAVTTRLGYRANGDDVRIHLGERRRVRRFVLERETWAAHRRDDIEISGLLPCLDLLGA